MHVALSDQHHPAPLHTAPAYPPSHGYPQPTQAPQVPAAQPASGGSLGMVALVIGVVGILLGLLVQPLYILNLASANPVPYELISLAGGGFGVIVAVAALVLGIIAIRKNARPLLGAVAIGIAIAQLAGVLLGWAANVTAGLLL